MKLFHISECSAVTPGRNCISTDCQNVANTIAVVAVDTQRCQAQSGHDGLEHNELHNSLLGEPQQVRIPPHSWQAAQRWRVRHRRQVLDALCAVVVPSSVLQYEREEGIHYKGLIHIS
eukprot:1452-Heterococcus_DN1.PRE.3